MKTSLLRIALVFLLFSFSFFVSRAQWVSIPDTSFANCLMANGYDTCLRGNSIIGWEIDTTCPGVENGTYLNCGGPWDISDLTGISYFNNLRHLDLQGNNLSSLPAMPPTLTFLNLSSNLFINLPSLPPALIEFHCASNQLTGLPPLPNTLDSLSCYNNPLTALPALPNSLTYLLCYANQLTNLPTLPTSLYHLGCCCNNLTSLPALPNGLWSLHCSNNQITSLPALPNSLRHLNCSYNQLSSLPLLPNPFSYLQCEYNQISSISELPAYINQCHIGNNPLTCLPRLGGMYNLQFENTLVTCLPNYGNIVTSTPPLNTLPICDLFNANGCEILWNILGKVYLDSNSNCIAENNETGVINVPVKLWRNNTLIQQMPTVGLGTYSFDTDSFSVYKMTIDTAYLPFNVTCPANNALYDTILAVDSLHNTKDFAVECKPGFDLVAQSIHGQRFRPARFTQVDIQAGDYANFFGSHCAAGLGGVVTVTINGPVAYNSPVSGALTPSVSGRVLTYNIADFGSVNFTSDFSIVVQTDTMASPGSQVCFTVSVTPISGDNNPANNTLTHCFTILNSWDPNDKQVYPEGNIAANQDWLTYTVNFQNTGTDTAIHIYIADTLDTDLDVSSFQLLAYSHQPVVQIIENAVRFNFANIYLPDSNVNEPASHGYVQYKIRIKDGSPVGTQIGNTAFIYFDFNAPVITNTVTNSITCTAPTSAITAQICSSDNYAFNGMLLNTTGVYQDTLSSINGCDTLVTLSLVVFPVEHSTLDTAIEQGSTYTLPSGNTVSVTGTYSDTLSSKDGCDSVVVTNLSVVNSVASVSSSSEIRIYPNPASTSVVIAIDESMLGVTGTITDIMGRKIVAVRLHTQNTKLNTSEFANGVYFLSITANEGNTITKKLVIHK